jgi:hypothetical protein
VILNVEFVEVSIQGHVASGCFWLLPPPLPHWEMKQKAGSGAAWKYGYSDASLVFRGGLSVVMDENHLHPPIVGQAVAWNV